MSDDRWETDGDEPYQPRPRAPVANPDAQRFLDGARAPRPRYGRTELPDRRRVTPDEIDAFLDQYCARMGIDRNKGRKLPGSR